MASLLTTHLKHTEMSRDENTLNKQKSLNQEPSTSPLLERIRQGEQISLREDIRLLEIECMQEALRQAQGNLREAAGILGIDVDTLRMRLKRWKLDDAA